MKIKHEIILIKIILAYSEINSKAKPPLPYSMLKPDTNSLSPSEKSKGVRLVSARQHESQQKNKGKEKNKNQLMLWIKLKLIKLYLSHKKKKHNKINDKDTS